MINSRKPFATTTPAQLPEFANIAIGGVAGSGKTHLMGTAGKESKILNIDVEGGAITYNSKNFKGDPNASDNIEIVSFDDFLSGKSDSATNLAARIMGVFDYLIQSKNSDGYDAVVVDSLTEYQALFIKYHPARDPRQSYGDLKSSLHDMILKAQLAPVNTFFTARLKVDQDEEGREIVRYDVSPASWSTVSGLFHAVGFMGIRAQGAKVKRTLDFSFGTRTPGKDRYGFSELTDPSLKDVLDVIKREGGDIKAVDTPARGRASKA